jgi:hypothetical protein
MPNNSESDKATYKKDEWSVEPVRSAEPESSVAGLRQMLQTLEQHIVDLQRKLSAVVDAPERIIR